MKKEEGYDASMHEGFLERNFGWLLLIAMATAGGGTWYLTDSVWYAALGAVTPLGAVVALSVYHHASSHWDHGSGVTPDGRIRWFGDDSN